MAQSSERSSSLAEWLLFVASGIDRGVRKLDGWLGGAGVIRAFGQRSVLAFLLPVPVIVFAVYGPVLLRPERGFIGRGLAPWVVVVFGILLQLAYFHRAKKVDARLAQKGASSGWTPYVHFALIAASALFSWYLAKADAKESSPGVYHHYYGWLATVTIAVGVFGAPWMAKRKVFCLPSDVAQEFADAFDPARAVASGPKRVATQIDLARAALTTVFQTPMHVLVLVAFAIVASTSDDLLWLALVMFVISFLGALAVNLDPCLDAFVYAVGRIFLSGASLLLTIVVLVLAVLRLAHVSYVTTVLDAGRANTIFSYLFSTYFLLWLYDFWMHRAVLNCVVDLERLSSCDCSVILHGGGRLRVSHQGVERIFEPAKLLHRIAETSPDEKRERLRALAAETDARLTGFAAVMGLMLCVFVCSGLYAARYFADVGASHTIDRATEGHPSPLFDLGAHLRSTSAGKEEPPVIMVAASGGGTRAALYTAAVLHGIDRLKRLEDVVAVSGVSGGSAALAYFAAFRKNLIHGTKSSWDMMLDTLAAPYIDDVLAGAGEWRMLGPLRIGQLLTESFDRHFESAAGKTGAAIRRDLRAVTDVGLVFNAGLCGQDADSGKKGSSDIAGGFAAITNMSTDFQAPTLGVQGWNFNLPVERVTGASMTLTRAASLSANFPPVFPNAALDGDAPNKRLWVTDGGAVENRGVISLLLALSDALSKMAGARPASAAGGGDSVGQVPWRLALRPVRIVVAEASAVDLNYRSDRGLGAKFGAATQIANGLISVLLSVVNQQYSTLTGQQSGDVRIVYLPMPDALRASGTFATHWMMPPRVPIGLPLTQQQLGECRVPPKMAIGLIDGIFDANPSNDFIRQAEKHGCADIADRLETEADHCPRKALLKGLGEEAAKTVAAPFATSGT